MPYPELNNTKENDYLINFKRNDNSRYIKNTLNSIKDSNINLVNSAMKKKVNELRDQISKIPAIFNDLRNRLSVNNASEKKKMEEYIANTGNHTASGYAVSKRLNNLNEFNKGLSDLSKKEADAIINYEKQIADTIYDANLKKKQIENEFNLKKMQSIIDEREKDDKYQFEALKLNNQNIKDYNNYLETKRLNDIKIEKTKNDILLDNNEDLRKSEIHSIEQSYLPEKYRADIDYTYEKIKSEIADRENKEKQLSMQQSAKSTSKSASKSSGEASSSKLSAKDIAKSIENLSGVKKYDSSGRYYTEIDPLKAYSYLMEWKKKYNLSFQVIIDAAIYLGIQDFF